MLHFAMTSQGGLVLTVLLASLLLFLSLSTLHNSRSTRLSRRDQFGLSSSREGSWNGSAADDASGTWGTTCRSGARSLAAMNTTEAEAAMEESALLLAIKDSMQAHDALACWSGGGNSSHCSGKWKGVSCDEVGHVSGMELAGLGLHGTISPAIGDLSHLVYLNLSHNNLVGQIPSKLASLKKLEVLSFQDNHLEGSIPMWLGGLSSLKELWLGENAFCGQIPSELASLKKLEVLCLNRNKLAGSIPTWFGGLSSLKELWLGENALSDHIPSELASLKKLEAFALNDNKLMGSIPTWLGGFSSLKILWLEKNAFSGHIPSELGNLKNLEYMQLQTNNLSSQIPSSLARCSRLKRLILSDNNLMGVLPYQFHNLRLWPNLSIFSISNNNLCGTFPLSYIGSSSKIQILNYSKNNFTSALPTKVNGSNLSNLRVFMVSYNRLEGPIPSWIGDLKGLQVLDLSNNVFIGTIPHNFGNLDGYKMQSNIPCSLESTFILETILSLGIRGPGIKLNYSYILLGTTYMDVSSNALEGKIPLGITNLIGMKYLVLSNNKFNGEISSIFQYMEELETLDLSQNELTGTIPMKLPYTLSTFNVSYNNLSGAIPLENQFNTFGISSYLPGNPCLCGNVIKRQCIDDYMQLTTSDIPNNEYQIINYASLIAFGIGFLCGFSIMGAVLCTWAPTFKYVFEDEIKRQTKYKKDVAAQLGDPQYYGLFKYPT